MPALVAPPLDARSLFGEGELPRAPQQARSRATRGALFEAAAELFLRRGYIGTNTKEIAKRAGMGVGTLYFHFRDKRQILIAMLVDKLREYPHLGTVDEEALRADPRGYVHAQLRAGYPYSRVYYGLIGAVQELAHQDPTFARAMTAVVKALHRQIRATLEVAREMGRGHPGADLDATARALAVLVYGFYNMLPNPATTSEADFWLRHEAAADIVYHAIFAS